MYFLLAGIKAMLKELNDRLSTAVVNGIDKVDTKLSNLASAGVLSNSQIEANAILVKLDASPNSRAQSGDIAQARHNVHKVGIDLGTAVNNLTGVGAIKSIQCLHPLDHIARATNGSGLYRSVILVNISPVNGSRCLCFVVPAYNLGRKNHPSFCFAAMASSSQVKICSGAILSPGSLLIVIEF